MLTMALKNLFLIWFLYNFAYSADCPSNFIEIDGGCYFKQHVDVLQDFIDINKNLKNTDILNIGHQEWTDSRLTYLYLGNQNISGGFTNTESRGYERKRMDGLDYKGIQSQPFWCVLEKKRL